MMLAAAALGLAYSGLLSYFQTLTGTNKGDGISGMSAEILPADVRQILGEEDYVMTINPELCASNELFKQGKCPA
jgi:hypothetical protein